LRVAGTLAADGFVWFRFQICPVAAPQFSIHADLTKKIEGEGSSAPAEEAMADLFILLS
jgi:hypothetical protein